MKSLHIQLIVEKTIWLQTLAHTPLVDVFNDIKKGWVFFFDLFVYIKAEI